MALVARLDQARSVMLARRNIYHELLSIAQGITTDSDGPCVSTQPVPALGQDSTMGGDDLSVPGQPAPALGQDSAMGGDGLSVPGQPAPVRNPTMGGCYDDSMCLFSPIEVAQQHGLPAGENGQDSIFHDTGLPRLLSTSLSDVNSMGIWAMEMRTSLPVLEIIDSDSVCISRSDAQDSQQDSKQGAEQGDANAYIDDPTAGAPMRITAAGRYAMQGVDDENEDLPMSAPMVWDSLGQFSATDRNSACTSPAPIFAPDSPARIESQVPFSREVLRQRLQARTAAPPPPTPPVVVLMEFLENGMQIPCVPILPFTAESESAEMHMGNIGNVYEFELNNVTTSAFKCYITQKKDTVRKIAKKHNLECPELLERNQHIKKLKIGSKMHEGIIMRV